MRDLVAAVGTFTIVAGVISIWMGFGTAGWGVAAIGGCLVWGSLRSRP